jgi:ligand-binding sensor domain-containing protein
LATTSGKCFLILALSLFVHSYILHAQSPSYVFRHITTENGLASNDPLNIIEDNKGFIWISTTKGFQKFDGSEFVTYSHDPSDTNSLRNEGGRCILEDGEGKIWLGQWPWGFSRFDPQTGKSTIINDSAGDKYRNLRNSVNACKDNLGNVWLCSGNLITKFDIKTHQLESFPKALPEDIDFTKYMYYDSVKHKIWLGSYTYGICLFDPDKHILYHRLNNPDHIDILNFNQPVGAMLVTGTDIWVNSYSSILYKYNLETRIWQQVYLQESQDPRLGPLSKRLEKGDLPIDWITEDSHGNVWFAARKYGLLEYSKTENAMHLIRRTSVYEEKGDLNYNEYMAYIFEDKDSNLWLSTDNGIFIFNPGSQKFNSAPLRPPGELPDTKYQVTTCIERKNGDIWVATYGGGIFVFDRSLHYKKRFASPVLQNNLVWCLLEQSDGKLIIGCQQGWLSLNDDGKNQFTSIQPAAIQHLTISNMVVDRENNIWMALFHGISKWDIKKNSFTWWDHFIPFRGTWGTVTCDILVDSQNKVWAGTIDHGLQKFDPDSGKFTEIYVPDNNNTNSIASVTIQSLTVIDKERLALATCDGGISIFNVRTRQFSNFNTRDGLPSNFISALLFDPPSNLWVATSQGLCIVNLTTRKITRFGTEDGIPSKDFDGLNHFCRLKNGDILAGYKGGIVRFNHSDSTVRPPPKDVIITGINVFEKKISLDSILDNSNEARFTHDQNFISIEYVSPSYLESNPVRYFYQLEGLDKDWVNAGERKIAYYTNLPAKTYLFKVKCERSDGVMCQDISYLKIMISPPFWQSWWFITLSILTGLLILYCLYRYRINELIRIQTIRNRISRDLHDDLGATLSSISVLSAVAKDNLEMGSREESYSLLNKINNYSREMVDKMRDIVWAINPVNDSLENLIQRLKNYSAELCNGRELFVQYLVDDLFTNIAVPMNARKNIYLICKEAIHNAAVHSKCAEIQVLFSASSSQINVEISDNGCGFNQKEGFTGNGLVNMGSRAKEINGKLTIHSSDSGTKVLLLLFVPHIRG